MFYLGKLFNNYIIQSVQLMGINLIYLIDHISSMRLWSYSIDYIYIYGCCVVI